LTNNKKLCIVEFRMEERFLTAEEAAKIFKVDTETMYRWLRKGVLPGIKIGGVWRVRVEDIEIKPEKVEIK